jgi:hypothetical protein
MWLFYVEEEMFTATLVASGCQALTARLSICNQQVVGSSPTGGSTSFSITYT